MKWSLLTFAAVVAASPFDAADFSKIPSYFQRNMEMGNGQLETLGTRVVNGVTVQRSKIRYGPFHIPGAEVLEPNSLQTAYQGRSKGSLTNVPSMNIKKPCASCVVTYFRASLEDESGKDLNVDEGLMLHHMVLFNGGAGHRDSTCGLKAMSLPHVSIQASARTTERIFSSGNERSVADFLGIGKKMGYRINASDKFSLLTDLMNMNTEAKDVYLTMFYDHIPLEEAQAQDFKLAKVVWLDANDCNTSDVRAPPGKKIFTIQSKKWTADFPGDIALSLGHVHDAGAALTVHINDKVVCTNTQKYGTSPRYIEMSAKSKLMARDRAMPGMAHISESSECQDLGSFKKGDRLHTVGHYDAVAHDFMRDDDGKPKFLMAIAILYVAKPLDWRL